MMQTFTNATNTLLSFYQWQSALTDTRELLTLDNRVLIYDGFGKICIVLRVEGYFKNKYFGGVTGINFELFL